MTPCCHPSPVSNRPISCAVAARSTGAESSGIDGAIGWRGRRFSRICSSRVASRGSVSPVARRGPGARSLDRVSEPPTYRRKGGPFPLGTPEPPVTGTCPGRPGQAGRSRRDRGSADDALTIPGHLHLCSDRSHIPVVRIGDRLYHASPGQRRKCASERPELPDRGGRTRDPAGGPTSIAQAFGRSADARLRTGKRAASRALVEPSAPRRPLCG